MDKSDVIRFLAQVVKGQGVTEGHIMLGKHELAIKVDPRTRTLFIAGLSDRPVQIKNYLIFTSRKSGKTEVRVSMSELRQTLGLDSLSAKALLEEAKPYLLDVHERVWVDADIFDSPKLRPYLVTLFLAKLHEIHKRYKDNIAVVLEGDSADIKEKAEALYPGETLFVTDALQLPDSFKGDAKDISLIPARSTGKHPGRRVYVDSLDDRSVLDISRLLDVTIVAGVVNNDPHTSFFEHFIQAYETLLGRKIRSEELAEFMDILEGRVHILKKILSYAVKPHAVDIQYTLRLYQLMIKMAEQAA